MDSKIRALFAAADHLGTLKRYPGWPHERTRVAPGSDASASSAFGRLLLDGGSTVTIDRDRSPLAILDEAWWTTHVVSFGKTLDRARTLGIDLVTPRRLIDCLGLAGIELGPVNLTEIWAGNELVIVPDMPHGVVDHVLGSPPLGDAAECVGLWIVGTSALNRLSLSPALDLEPGPMQMAWQLTRAARGGELRLEVAFRTESGANVVTGRGSADLAGSGDHGCGWVVEVTNHAEVAVRFFLDEASRAAVTVGVLTHACSQGQLQPLGFVER